MPENTHKFNLDAALKLGKVEIDKGALSALSASISNAIKGPTEKALQQLNKEASGTGKSMSSGVETAKTARSINKLTTALSNLVSGISSLSSVDTKKTVNSLNKLSTALGNLSQEASSGQSMSKLVNDITNNIRKMRKVMSEQAPTTKKTPPAGKSTTTRVDVKAATAPLARELSKVLSEKLTKMQVSVDVDTTAVVNAIKQSLSAISSGGGAGRPPAIPPSGGAGGSGGGKPPSDISKIIADLSSSASKMISSMNDASKALNTFGDVLSNISISPKALEALGRAGAGAAGAGVDPFAWTMIAPGTVPQYSREDILSLQRSAFKLRRAKGKDIGTAVSEDELKKLSDASREVIEKAIFNVGSPEKVLDKIKGAFEESGAPKYSFKGLSDIINRVKSSGGEFYKDLQESLEGEGDSLSNLLKGAGEGLKIEGGDIPGFLNDVKRRMNQALRLVRVRYIQDGIDELYSELSNLKPTETGKAAEIRRDITEKQRDLLAMMSSGVFAEQGARHNLGGEYFNERVPVSPAVEGLAVRGKPLDRSGAETARFEKIRELLSGKGLAAGENRIEAIQREFSQVITSMGDDTEALIRAFVDLRKVMAGNADEAEILRRVTQQYNNALTRSFSGQLPTKGLTVSEQASVVGGLGQSSKAQGTAFATAAKVVSDNLKDFNGGIQTSELLFDKLNAASGSVLEFKGALDSLISLVGQMRGPTMEEEFGRKDIVKDLKNARKDLEQASKQGLEFEDIKSAVFIGEEAFSEMSMSAIGIAKSMKTTVSPAERVQELFRTAFGEAQGDIKVLKDNINIMVSDFERARKADIISKEDVAAAKSLRKEIEAFTQGKTTKTLTKEQQVGLARSDIEARQKALAPGQKQVFLYQIKDETGQGFKRLRVAMKRTAAESNRLKVSIKELPPAVNVLGSEMQTAFRRVALWGTAAGITYGAVNAFRNAVKVMADVEVGVIKVGKVMNQATANFDAFEGQVIQTASRISTEFGTAIEDVLSTMFTFAQQGLPMPDVSALAETTALAANVTNLAGPQAAEALTAAFRQFNLEAQDSSRILDSWNEVANRFAVEEDVLADALKKSGIAARNAGVSFDEFNGIVAAVGSATRQKGKEIGTSLKFIFQRLTRPISVKALKNVGVEVLDVEGNFRGFMNVLGDLNQVWGNLTNTQKLSVSQSVAGIRQYNAFLTIMDEFEEVQSATEASTKSQGSAMRENAKVMESAAKQWSVMIELVKQTAVELGGVFLPVAKGVIGVFSGITSGLNALPTPLKAVVGSFAVLGVASLKAADKVDMLLSGLSSIPENASGIGPALSNAFRSIGSGKTFESLPESMRNILNLKEKTGSIRKSTIQVGDFAKGGLGEIATKVGKPIEGASASMTKFQAAVTRTSVASDVAAVGISDMNSIFSKLFLTLARAGQTSFGAISAFFKNIPIAGKKVVASLRGTGEAIKFVTVASEAGSVASRGFLVSLGALGVVIAGISALMWGLGKVYGWVFDRGDKVAESMKSEIATREEQLSVLRKTGDAYKSLARDRRELARFESIAAGEGGEEKVAKLKSEGRFTSPVSLRLNISDKESRLLENIGPLALKAVEGFDLFGNAVITSSDALNDYSTSAEESAATMLALTKATAANAVAAELVEKKWYKWTNALEQFDESQKKLKDFAKVMVDINKLSPDFMSGELKPSKYFSELQKDALRGRAELDKYTNSMNEFLDTLPKEAGVSFFQNLLLGKDEEGEDLSRILEAAASVANKQLIPALGAMADKTDILNSIFVKTKTGLKNVGEVGEKTLANFESAGFSAIDVTSSNISSVSETIRSNARKFKDSVALITEPGRSFMKNALVTLNREGDAVISFFDEFGNYIKKSLQDLVGEGGKVKIIEKGAIKRQLEEELLDVKKIITGAGAGTIFPGEIKLGARLEFDLSAQQRVAKSLPGLFKEATLAQSDYNRTLEEYTKTIGESTAAGSQSVDLTKRISKEMVDELNRLAARLNFGALLVRFATDIQEVGIQAEKAAYKLEELKSGQIIDAFLANFRRGAEKGLIDNLKFEPIKLGSELKPDEVFQKQFGRQIQGVQALSQDVNATRDIAARFDMISKDFPKLIEQFRAAQKEFRNPEEVEDFARALRETGDVSKAIDKTAVRRDYKTKEDILKEVKGIHNEMSGKSAAQGLSPEEVKKRKDDVLGSTASVVREQAKYFRDIDRVTGTTQKEDIVPRYSKFVAEAQKLSGMRTEYRSAVYSGKSDKELADMRKGLDTQRRIAELALKEARRYYNKFNNYASREERKDVNVALGKIRSQVKEGEKLLGKPLSQDISFTEKFSGIINRLVVSQKGKTSVDTKSVGFQEAIDGTIRALLQAQIELEKRKKALLEYAPNASFENRARRAAQPGMAAEYDNVSKSLSDVNKLLRDRAGLNRLAKSVAEEQLRRLNEINDLKKKEKEEEEKRAQELIDYFKRMIDEAAGVTKSLAAASKGVEQQARSILSIALGVAKVSNIFNTTADSLERSLSARRFEDALNTPVSGALRGVTTYSPKDFGKLDFELTPIEALSKKFPDMMRSFSEFESIVAPGVKKAIIDVNEKMLQASEREKELRSQGYTEEADAAREAYFTIKESRDKLSKTYENMRDDIQPLVESLRKMQAAETAAQKVDQLVEGLRKFGALQYDKTSINRSLGQSPLSPVNINVPGSKDKFTTEINQLKRSLTTTFMSAAEQASVASKIRELKSGREAALVEEKQRPQTELFQRQVQAAESAREVLYELKQRGAPEGQYLLDDVTRRLEKAGEIRNTRWGLQRRGVDISDISGEIRRLQEKYKVEAKYTPDQNLDKLRTTSDNQLKELQKQTDILKRQLDVLSGRAGSGIKAASDEARSRVTSIGVAASKGVSEAEAQRSTLTKSSHVGGGLPKFDTGSVSIRPAEGKQGLEQGKVDKAILSMVVGATNTLIDAGKVFKLEDYKNKARVKGYAYGGTVFGAPGVDRVPAMLTAGEYVVNRSSVQSIGLSRLEYMNRSGNVPRFATGGLVGDRVKNNGTATLDVGLASEELYKVITQAFDSGAEVIKSVLSESSADISAEEVASQISQAFSAGAEQVSSSFSTISFEGMSSAISEAFSAGAESVSSTLQNTQINIGFSDDVETLSDRMTSSISDAFNSGADSIRTAMGEGLTLSVPDNIQELLTVSIPDAGLAGPGARRIDAVEGSVEILMDKLSNIDNVISQGAFGSGITLEEVDRFVESRLNEVSGSFDVKLNERFSTSIESVRAEVDSKITNKISTIIPEIQDSKNTAVQALGTAQSALSRAMSR